MKFLTVSLGLISSSSFALSQDGAFLNAPVEASAEIKYGIEALTTWRSEYVYRGFALADNSMEFQLAGQVALSNIDTLDIGLFYGTATSDGDFTEAAAFIDFSRDIGDLTYATTLTLRDYTNSAFQSGADIGGSVSWAINEDVDLRGSLHYDTDAEGFYFEAKAGYYRQVNDDSYLTMDAGLGLVANYYDRNGIHQAFAKLAYTYNINDAVSVSPYLQMSLGVHDDAGNYLVAGAYFAVSF